MENEEEVILDDDFEQANVDDFSFICSSSVDVVNYNGDEASEYSDDDEDDSSDDQSGSRRFKIERKHDLSSKDDTDEQDRKRRRYSSTHDSKERERAREDHRKTSSSSSKDKYHDEKKHKRDEKDGHRNHSYKKDDKDRDKERREKEKDKDKDKDKDKEKDKDKDKEKDKEKDKDKERDRKSSSTASWSSSSFRKDRDKDSSKEIDKNPSKELDKDPQASRDDQTKSDHKDPESNGTSSPPKPILTEEERKEERKEKERVDLENFHPELKTRNTSKFAERLKSKLETKAPAMTNNNSSWGSSFSSSSSLVTEEDQPRYRDYRSKKKDSRSNFDGNWPRSGGVNQNNSNNTSSHSQFATEPNPYLNPDYLLQPGGLFPASTYSSHPAYATFDQLQQVGAPPIPGGSLLPGITEPFAQLLKKSVTNLTNTNGNSTNGVMVEQPIPKPPSIEPVPHSVLPAHSTTTKLPSGIAMMEERRVTFKQQASKIVCSRLSKYLKEGRIANKEDFKHLSRKLTHKVMVKEESSYLMAPKTPKKINKLVDNFFQKTKVHVYHKHEKAFEAPKALQQS